MASYNESNGDTRAMTTYVVTRHQGAVQWLADRGFEEAVVVSHWTPEHVASLAPGDQVVGVLPLQMVAEVCEHGAHFWNLSIQVPSERRGDELSAEDMESFGAQLEKFQVIRL